MPIMRLASERRIYQPEELALLGRVFDRLLEPQMEANKREALASRIIANYMAGIKGEEELVSSSKQPLGR